jgi:RNA polymerase sigma factor FliA
LIVQTPAVNPTPAFEPYGSSGFASPAGPVASPGAVDALEERELWERWHEARDPGARALLADRYLPYARALAAKCYARRAHNEFEFNEYLHFAVVGMMESLDRYMPDRGAQFKTFATPRINGAILNGLDGLSERQQQIGLRRRLARERIESLKTESGTLDRGHRLLQDLGDIGIGLALGFLLEGTGMLVDADDQLPDNAYAHIELRQLRERIWQLVKQLTEREAQVIHRHYFQRQNFEEIATDLVLTKGRISQLHRQGLVRIRRLAEASGNCNVVW